MHKFAVAVAVALVAGGCGRQPAAPAQTHVIEASRDRLAGQFIWSATLNQDLGSGTLTLSLAGQTGELLVVADAQGGKVRHNTGAEVTDLSTFDWHRSPKSGTVLQVVASDGLVAVVQDGRLVSHASVTPQRWQAGSWKRSVDLGVAEGQAIADYSFQKTAPIYFSDDFMHNENELGEWNPVSGHWQIHALRNPTRSVNAFSLVGNGEPAVAAAGHWFWRNYTFSTAVFTAKPAPFAIYSHYQDGENFYALSADPEDGKIRLTKSLDGKRQELAVTSAVVLPGQWSRISLTHQFGQLSATLDGAALFTVVDPEPFAFGKVAVGTHTKADVQFDDTEVRTAAAFAVDLSKPLPANVHVVTADHDCSLNCSSGLETVSIFGLPLRQYSMAVPFSGVGALSLSRGKSADTMINLSLQRNADDSRIVLTHRGKELGRTTAQVADSATLSLHNRGDRVWAAVDDRIVLTAEGDFSNGGAFNVSGCVTFTGVKIGPQLSLPPVENRVKAFEHEETMSAWSRPGSEWVSDRLTDETVYWHRTDFWRDVGVTSAVKALITPDVKTIGLAFSGRDDAPFEDTIRLCVDTLEDGSYQAVLNLGDDRSLTKPLSAVPKALRLERRQGRLLASFDEAVAWNVPLPGSLERLCRVGRIGGIVTDKWADAVSIGAEGVRSYSFKRAPVDWLPAAGDWEVTNRWQCDPRWSFYSGYTRNGVACNWHKLRHGENLSVDFFVGPKMQQERGYRYEYAADMNAVICADAKDVRSGYSFMLGGWNNRGSQILRHGEELFENRQVRLSRDMTMHRRWMHVKIRKNGDQLSFWVDNVLVAKVRDPEPLPAGHIGLWTWDNGVMIAQMHVSTDGDLSGLQLAQAPPRKPLTPYDP
jgi:hypothetical protein